MKGPQGRRRIPNALPNLVFKAWRLMVTKLIRIHLVSGCRKDLRQIVEIRKAPDLLHRTK